MTSHQRARAWRLARGLTVRALSDLTGFSPESIVCFERGTAPRRAGEKRKAVNPHAFHRYRMACAGVEASRHAGGAFDWTLGWGG